MAVAHEAYACPDVGRGGNPYSVNWAVDAVKGLKPVGGTRVACESWLPVPVAETAGPANGAIMMAIIAHEETSATRNS